MNQEDIIKKIKYIEKFKTETVNIEVKSAKVDFPKNVMIQYRVFQINMVEL